MKPMGVVHALWLCGCTEKRYIFVILWRLYVNFVFCAKYHNGQTILRSNWCDKIEKFIRTKNNYFDCYVEYGDNNDDSNNDNDNDEVGDERESQKNPIEMTVDNPPTIKLTTFFDNMKLLKPLMCFCVSVCVISISLSVSLWSLISSPYTFTHRIISLWI